MKGNYRRRRHRRAHFPEHSHSRGIKRREDKTEVIFIGTEHGIEARIIPREGYPIKF